MTFHIADIASYQGELTLAQLQAAGFTGINVKVSHGKSQRSVHPNVKLHVQHARALGMHLSSFHWLDGSASGAEQAGYAYAHMYDLGLNKGAAHVVDVEDDTVTTAIYLDYCATMTRLLGRPIATYTGDWWWTNKTWTSPHSPWLWSAPRAGYLIAYPGDASAHWAGYGPWEELAVMQYRVAAVAGIKVSQSAVRSDRLWRTMAGEREMPWQNIPASLALRDELNKAFPTRDKASDGFIGDPAHAATSSDHNPDETGITPFEDSDAIDEVHAYDADVNLDRAGWTMERVVQIILSRCRTGAEKRIRYIIYNRRIWRASNGWAQEAYTGPSAHTEHAHFSYYYGSGSGVSNPENITTPYGILAEIEKETPVALTKEDLDKIADTVWRYGIPAPKGSNDADGVWRALSYLQWTYPAAVSARDYAADARTTGAAVLGLVETLASNGTVDPNALAGALAGPLASALAPLINEKGTDITATDLRDALLDILNGRANEQA